jgi:hypothetical protein
MRLVGGRPPHISNFQGESALPSLRQTRCSGRDPRRVGIQHGAYSPKRRLCQTCLPTAETRILAVEALRMPHVDTS